MEINSHRAILVAPLSFLGLLVFTELIMILSLNSSQFVYSLDDPYIHLALAENLASGHYGLNTTEFSAPSSSILWPLILAPLSNTTIGVYIPLILNIVFSILTLIITVRVLKLSLCKIEIPDKSKNQALTVILFFLILSTNMVGLIFIGMEHSLQVLLSTIIVWGSLIELEKNRITPLFIIALIIAPLIRYECLALSLPILGYLFLKGHYKISITVTIISIFLLIGYSYFLLNIGLNRLPTSIIAKTDFDSFNIINLILKLYDNLDNGRGVMLAILVIFFIFYIMKSNPMKLNSKNLLVGCISIGIFTHLLMGDFGFFGRYEIYIWTVALLTFIYLFGEVVLKVFMLLGIYRFGLLMSTLVILTCSPYIKTLLTTPIASNNVYEQQYQMHRFVASFYKKPIAVNDIGFVSFKNESYVLDLWGLASLETLSLRKKFNDTDWMNDVSQKHGVELAIIYENWFIHIPDSWIKIGELHLSKRNITVADRAVSFYSLNPRSYHESDSIITNFVKSLPQNVKFERASVK